MRKKPTEMKAPEGKPYDIVEQKIQEAAREPFLPGIRDGYYGFRRRWLDGEIDAKALGLKSSLKPEEAAIAIAGKAQEQRNEAQKERDEIKKVAAMLLKENWKLVEEIGELKQKLEDRR